MLRFVQKVFTFSYWEMITFARDMDSVEVLHFTPSLTFARDVWNVPVRRYEACQKVPAL